MNIQLNPKNTIRPLIRFSLILLLANVVAIFVRFNFYSEAADWHQKLDFVRVLIQLFDFDTETNIPTMYSAFLLLFCAFLLLLKAIYNKQNRVHFMQWMGLSLVFVFLSVDEMVSLHEHLISLTKHFINVSGLLYYAWVIPYGIAIVLLTILYYPFLRQRPKKILKLFIWSFVIFVAGAIGFEMLGGRQVELYGEGDPLYAFFYTMEESLEISGVLVFIYALLSGHNYAIKISDSGVSNVDTDEITNKRRFYKKNHGGIVS